MRKPYRVMWDSNPFVGTVLNRDNGAAFPDSGVNEDRVYVDKCVRCHEAAVELAAVVETEDFDTDDGLDALRLALAAFRKAERGDE